MISDAGYDRYVLTLDITGQMPKSQCAIRKIRKISVVTIKLEIIDIYQQPELANEGKIVAACTLIKKLRLPLRRLVVICLTASRHC